MAWDNVYKAKYKVLKNLHGDYQGDTIEFEAFDHYGKPAFSHYKNVLLFVSEHDGKLYHVKYQYFDVYQTKNGSWASPGNPYRFHGEKHSKHMTFQQIEFKEPVKIEVRNGLKMKTPSILELGIRYTAPYFVSENSIAIAYTGTEVQDLFLVKKENALKAFGFFLE